MQTDEQISHQLSFRSITESDLPFLRKLYGTTRQEEMDLLHNWSREEKHDFLDQQFHAQHSFYQQSFPKAQFDLVSHRGIRIGRLYQEERIDEIRIIDIAIIPQYRNQGIGSKLIREIIDRAENINKCVRIHVEHNNRALHLYLNLGFQQIDTSGVYFLMEFRPSIKDAADA